MGMAKPPAIPAAPPPPPMLANANGAAADQTDAAAAANGKYGASGTILTGPQGVLGNATTAGKALLGS